MNAPHAKGHILHRNKIYVSAAQAGQMMGVSRTTIKRWHSRGVLHGILIGSRRNRRGRLYILKDALDKSLLKYQCTVCGREVQSPTLRDPAKNHFCSKKCCDKWWNIYRPVRSDGTRDNRKVPTGRKKR